MKKWSAVYLGEGALAQEIENKKHDERLMHLIWKWSETICIPENELCDFQMSA